MTGDVECGTKNFIFELGKLEEIKEDLTGKQSEINKIVSGWFKEKGFDIEYKEIEQIVYKWLDPPVVIWARQIMSARVENLVFNDCGKIIAEQLYGDEGRTGGVTFIEDIMISRNPEKRSYCLLPIGSKKVRVAPMLEKRPLKSLVVSLSQEDRRLLEDYFGFKIPGNLNSLPEFHHYISNRQGIEILGNLYEVHKEIFSILTERKNTPLDLWSLENGKVERRQVAIDDISPNVFYWFPAETIYRLVFYPISLMPDIVYMMRDGISMEKKFWAPDMEELGKKLPVSIFPPIADLGDFGKDEELCAYPGKDAVEKSRSFLENMDFSKSLPSVSAKIAANYLKK